MAISKFDQLFDLVTVTDGVVSSRHMQNYAPHLYIYKLLFVRHQFILVKWKPKYGDQDL